MRRRRVRRRFARVLICVDKITGSAGMARYREQLRKANADSATSDSFVARLIEIRYDTGESGKTASEILCAVDLAYWQAKPVDWPRKARTVTTRLAKSAPALRKLGWTVDSDGGHNKDSIVKWAVRPPRENHENDEQQAG